jgi:hypothetical protein
MKCVVRNIASFISGLHGACIMTSRIIILISQENDSKTYAMIAVFFKAAGKKRMHLNGLFSEKSQSTLGEARFHIKVIII